MPTLHWIGKEKVINHHMDVPFKVLEHSYGFADGKQTKEETGSGNKIIHGDNLEALKSLLPGYEGRINCIYIDPPYNTGNENWVYNDNVNDPKIKKWLKQVVGKEGEDLSRHDKWLCMMYPRLKLLHKLLDPEGSIFISLDDNEQANMRIIMDEVFGGGNFVGNIVWQKRTSPDARLNLGPAHDFVLCYAKEKNRKKFNLVPLTQGREKEYKNPDNDPRGLWASVDLTGQKGHATENQFYAITTPDGRTLIPPKNRCWAIAETTFKQLLVDNRIWFGKNGTAKPRQKKFLFESEGTTVWTWWQNNEVGHNQEAAKELLEIFGNEAEFETPKPTRLLDRILRLATDKTSIILDCFAGSGTTAHAVLNINKQDKGQRKFILVQLDETDKKGQTRDIANLITAERVKRVIKGYADKEGTGGSFDFYELGKPLFHEDGNLNEEVPLQKIRSYIFYTETKKPLEQKGHKDNEAFLGKHSDTAYYFHYKPDDTTTLDHTFLATMKTKASQYVVYADNCLLSAAYLAKHNIIFKKIPRDVSRF